MFNPVSSLFSVFLPNINRLVVDDLVSRCSCKGMFIHLTNFFKMTYSGGVYRKSFILSSEICQIITLENVNLCLCWKLRD